MKVTECTSLGSLLTSISALNSVKPQRPYGYVLNLKSNKNLYASNKWNIITITLLV